MRLTVPVPSGNSGSARRERGPAIPSVRRRRGAFPLLALALALVVAPARAPAQASQTPAELGADRFLRDKPGEALPYLEAAVKANPSDTKSYFYLGICYQQLGRLDDAVGALRKALVAGSSDEALVAFATGNAYFAQGKASFAEPFYTRAVTADPSMASAYLNRANSRVKIGSYSDAVADYGTYLSMEPSSPKRPAIEKILAAINDQLAAEATAKANAAAAAAAEEARRKALLDEVSASLQAAAEDTKSLQAGSEDVIQYDGEFVLE